MNATQKTTVLVPVIMPVSGYILRNGQILPDDGGPGELIFEAICMPDGRLEPAHSPDLNRIVECGGRYGITIGESKPMAPESGRHDLIIKVRWADNYAWTRVDQLTKINPA